MRRRPGNAAEIETSATAPNLGSTPGLAPYIRPLLGKGDLPPILGIGLRTFERLMASGEFPKPDLRIGRRPRWCQETVQRWIAGGGAK